MRHWRTAIVCGCGAQVVTEQGQTAAQLRDHLADAGWFTDAARDYDLCPACLDAMPGFRVVACPHCHLQFVR